MPSELFEQLEKVYEPARFEPHWANWWVREKIYEAKADAPGPVFSLAIPPPNVTGSLHMGHMMEHTLIDMVVRWKRMSGYNTLWLPGTDHAGIATQMVVERRLAKDGLLRREMGREAFLAKVWEWKAESGGRIVEQMKRVGASCDWTRERFTLDDGLSRAVREVFVGLYERGLIYRGEYMVNWSPGLMTAVSDLEVDHEEQQGFLWHIKYPVVGSDDVFVVATTRPETMLGDTAVAVHPDDPRYKHLHGKMVALPLTGREIPIIADTMVDPKFGTGVVKITPAHDPNDFAAGTRHGLARIQVIGFDAKMTSEAGAYVGLDRYDARAKVVADLEALGLMAKIEPYVNKIGKCQRSGVVVEPMVSKQWFASMKPLAEKAMAAVRDGRTTIEPEQWRNTYFQWLEGIRDWCVSRQLWWGHRIPAWFCEACEKSGETSEPIVARETPTACPKCASTTLRQETDVLDTWFSSGLWPFSTLGWPDQTADLKKYYPTELMIMGYEILFFWCARMMMLGLEFMDEVPFRHVYIHGIVRDAQGKKMSKTRGNTIDPLDIIEKYGTDAVRMALLTSAAPGTDILWTEDKLPAARSFGNKIWNACRFLFLNMERAGIEPCIPEPAALTTLEDRWIASRLNSAAKACDDALAANRYHEAAQAIWHFFWDDFCDWYIELKKLSFKEGSGLDDGWRNLLATFERALRLMHPAMPFLTEELWQRLAKGATNQPKSIALAVYPVYKAEAHDAEAERQMELLQGIITTARNLRAEMKVDPKAQMEGTLSTSGDEKAVAEAQLEAILKLANLKLTVTEGSEGLKIKANEQQIQAQRNRLLKENEQLEKNIANHKRQLADEKFTSKVPAKILEGMHTKMAEYEQQLAKNVKTLESL
jgi:valyl-tRNA synthetase